MDISLSVAFVSRADRTTATQASSLDTRQTFTRGYGFAYWPDTPHWPADQKARLAGETKMPPAGALRLRDDRQGPGHAEGSVGGCGGLIIPPAIDLGKPSRPGLAGQDRSSGRGSGALCGLWREFRDRVIRDAG